MFKKTFILIFVDKFYETTGVVNSENPKIYIHLFNDVLKYMHKEVVFDNTMLRKLKWSQNLKKLKD